MRMKTENGNALVKKYQLFKEIMHFLIFCLKGGLLNSKSQQNILQNDNVLFILFDTK